MTETPLQPLPENRLRRWWRRVHEAVQAMEISEQEILADRIERLEQRVRQLEAAPPPQGR